MLDFKKNLLLNSELLYYGSVRNLIGALNLPIIVSVTIDAQEDMLGVLVIWKMLNLQLHLNLRVEKRPRETADLLKAVVNSQ